MEINITLPTAWEQLTDRQLRYVCRLLSTGFSTEDIETFFVLRSLPAHLPRLALYQLAYATEFVRFLGTPPAVPVRPAKIGRATALAPDLQDITFAQYLLIDNFYAAFLSLQSDQSHLSFQSLQSLQSSETREPREPSETSETTKATEAATALLSALYVGYKASRYQPWHAVAAVLWLTGLKAQHVLLYPDLFHTAAAAAAPTDQRTQMETMIRALTDGDITKRDAVLQSPLPAALYELNEKAREAEDVRRAAAKH